MVFISTPPVLYVLSFIIDVFCDYPAASFSFATVAAAAVAVAPVLDLSHASSSSDYALALFSGSTTSILLNKFLASFDTCSGGWNCPLDIFL